MTRNRARALAMTGSTITALLAFAGFVSSRYELAWGPLSLSSGAVGGHWPLGAARKIPMLLLTHRPDLYDNMHPECWWPAVEKNGETRVMVPLWTLLLLTAIPTAFLIAAVRSFSPRGCWTCGYDLSASPSLPCPECGAEPAS